TTVGVEAADPDGAIEQVEFFADGVSIGVAENPPWNMQWANVEAGEYQLTAVATDDDGLTATSDSWVVYGLNTLGFARYEAEDAVVSGAVTVANSPAASGSAYLDMRDSGT